MAKVVRLLFLIYCTLLSAPGNITAQQLSSLSPNSAKVGQNIDVFIRGANTHFQNGVSRADFGPGITVQNFSVTNAITATATILVSAGASVGNRNVQITTGREVVTGSNMFQVFSNAFNVNLVVLPIESISLKNIDLTNPSATPELFYTDIFNDNTSRTINLSLAFSNTAGLLGTMTLKNISVAPAATPRFSNRDFTSVKINGTNGTNFLNTVEITGTFPPDNYTYMLTVTDATSGTVLATNTTTETVTNPMANPELITPGMTFTGSVPDEYVADPLFQWFGQNDNYNFALYLYTAGQTAQDVVRGLPVYQQKGITGTSLMYPASAEKLIDGQTYAWQITGLTVTGSGTQTMPSEVFRFRYSEPGSGKTIVSSIQIVPTEISLTPGQQYQFTALCYDQNGALVANANPIWQVTPALGTITPTGLFTAGTQTATMAVLASAGTATQYSTVNINPAASATAGQDWLIDDILSQLFGLPQPQ